MAQAHEDQFNDLDEILGVYEKHGRVLEPDHWGEFLAVSADGQVMTDASYDALFQRAAKAFGSGVFFFRIGEVAVGSMRCLR
jgi:hypothetical protein